MIQAVSSYGSSGASTRVRLLDWLQHINVAYTHHDWAGFPDNRPKRLARHPIAAARAEWNRRHLDLRGHTLVMSREASPFSRGGLESAMLSAAGHSVFDFDDAIFEETGGLRDVVTAPNQKFRRCVSAADVVLAGNEYLADRAAAYSSDVRVIPSCVEPAHYRPKSGWELPPRPTLVWLGSPSGEAFVVGIAKALAAVHSATGARLRLISGPADNPALQPIAHMIDRVPWTSDGVADLLATSDVAIAPLDNSPFARGKCAYKVLQYAAAALPIVGSPVGANAGALDTFDGLAPQTPDDWQDALIEMLTESVHRRETRGHAGRAGVESRFSFARWAPDWRAAALG